MLFSTRTSRREASWRHAESHSWFAPVCVKIAAVLGKQFRAMSVFGTYPIGSLDVLVGRAIDHSVGDGKLQVILVDRASDRASVLCKRLPRRRVRRSDRVIGGGPMHFSNLSARKQTKRPRRGNRSIDRSDSARLGAVRDLACMLCWTVRRVRPSLRGQPTGSRPTKSNLLAA